MEDKLQWLRPLTGAWHPVEMEDGGLGEQQSSGESEDGESWSLPQYDTCGTVDIRGYIITALSPSVSPGVWRWHHNYWLSHSEVIHNNPSPDELHTSAGEATVIVQRFVPC